MIAPRDNAMMTSDVWPQMKSCIAYCQLPGIHLATVYNLEFDWAANASAFRTTSSNILRKP